MCTSEMKYSWKADVTTPPILVWFWHARVEPLDMSTVPGTQSSPMAIGPSLWVQYHVRHGGAHGLLVQVFPWGGQQTQCLVEWSCADQGLSGQDKGTHLWDNGGTHDNQTPGAVQAIGCWIATNHQHLQDQRDPEAS